ncbi:polyadenylation and cleavage factor homolog 11-like isoform X2 [Oscarella lobularis]|uniref:polyadenylation and cleavage factor homolog 11-like isoform X2 n=1 Tax=Oscarella lobularis TaxID=121494 RepID=UPI0033131F7B
MRIFVSKMSDADEFMKEYASSLENLAINSKPIINDLTILADENRSAAPGIVRTIEARLNQVQGKRKMPILYLLDSITKNVGGRYIEIFSQNLVSTFCTVFEQADDQMRRDLYKLRQTWGPYFPPKKLYTIDVRVNGMDSNWPITAASGSIHVNPKFLSAKDEPSPPPPPSSSSSSHRRHSPHSPPPPRRIVEVVERPPQPPKRNRHHDVIGRGARDPNPNRRERDSQSKRRRLNDADAADGLASSYHRPSQQRLASPQLSDEHQSSILRHLLLMPSERLLDNEHFVLSQAQRLLEMGGLSDKDTQRLYRLLKELHQQQQEREEQRMLQGRLAPPLAPSSSPSPLPLARPALLPNPSEINVLPPPPLPSQERHPPPPDVSEPAAPPIVVIESGPGPRRLIDPAEEETLIRRHQEIRRQEEEVLRRQREEEIAWQKRQDELARLQQKRTESQKLDKRPSPQPPPSSRPATSNASVNKATNASDLAEKVRPHMATTVTDLFQKLLQSGILTQAQATSSSSSNQRKIGAAERLPLPPIRLVLTELKEPIAAVIESLHAGQQCSSCGLRFIGAKSGEYDAHLDWHFKMNRREKTNKMASRQWMIPADDWTKFIDYDKLEDTARSTVFDMELEEAKPKEEKVISCPVLSDEDEVCPICNESFEQFFHEESDEWHFKDAIRLDNQVYHVSCHEDAAKEPSQS